MTDKDDLRFGDVSGSETGSGSGSRILEMGTEALVGLIMFYLFLKFVEILFNIPIPFI